ncbi:MAG: alpha/beta hydrolase [Pseudomonadota bacterium]
MKALKGELEVGRFRVPYRRYGTSPNLLVGVSGALQTMAVWSMFVKRFSDTFTVLIFDMPGIGKSEILDGPVQVSIEEHVQVVHALVEAHRLGGSTTLAGSSWGTAICAAYASRHPAEVDNLLLGSFGLKPNEAMRDVIKRAREVYDSGEWATGASLIIDEFGQSISETYKKMIQAQFRAITRDHAENFYEHCAYIERAGELEDFVDLGNISARTFIVNGAQDTILDLGDIHIAHEKIPNCRIAIIEGAGHFLHFERPELMELYAEFLDGNDELPLAEYGG